ncbi:hypothetical protein SAMN05661093_05705 [Kibdelosporangium aridum]|uniref:Uncharacterized protein n=1 Tax=Kibdelosporangium aridum TaxID=2030 RepID=A0A1Y5XUJ1_KIBAR|nr:hypothetical protein SAMN05661093_05705 [Kibdelosporangium aridum]
MEKLISDRLRAAREQPEAVRGASINLQEINGIATGLTAAGVLTPQDGDRLLTDLRKTMERAGWITVVRHHTSETSHFGPTAFARRSSDAPPVVRGPAAVQPTDPHDLLRVVSLVGRSVKHGDISRTFISLEVWSGALILRSALPQDSDWQSESIRQFFDGRIRWRAWDDHGTQYRSTSMSGGSSSAVSGLLFENRAFFPSPPEGADLLTVIAEHPDHQAVVELPLH